MSSNGRPTKNWIGLGFIVLVVTCVAASVRSSLALRKAYRELEEGGRPMSWEELLALPVPKEENGAVRIREAMASLEDKHLLFVLDDKTTALFSEEATAAEREDLMRSLIFLGLASSAAIGYERGTGTTYYVSQEGHDGNDGLSPKRAWQSLSKVNSAHLEPGDSVFFKRGDVWRGQLRPRSGNEKGSIRYGAYGEGPKPLLLGSVRLDDPEDWFEASPHIWSTFPPRPQGKDLLKDPASTEGPSSWSLYCEEGAKALGGAAEEEGKEAVTAYRVTCQSVGKSGCHIQFYTSGIPIQAGKTYLFSFRSRGSVPFSLSAPTLMKAGPPWSKYAPSPVGEELSVEPEWRSHELFYTANTTDTNARITFFLGTDLPGGETLFLQQVSFKECRGRFLPCDVGNIIFDDERSCGVKVWNEGDLSSQGQYWYDEQAKLLKLWSEECPAERYSSIECALRRHIIDQSGISHVIYENLALKYGGAHGIGGANTHHIVVRNCDLGYIGGGDQRGGEHTVRYGNGVEFWANARDSLVEGCRLWEIYDAALTNQNNGPHVVQENITYRNNVIWNCEYSFEYWNRPENSLTENILFENNTCVNAGHGWGHSQRPDPSGRHLCFYSSPAQAKEIVIRNNIFYEAKRNAFYAPTWEEEQMHSLHLEGNCWFQASGTMISLKGRSYTADEFNAYQREEGIETRSIVADPGFLAPEEDDYRLKEDSPCKNAGVVQ